MSKSTLAKRIEALSQMERGSPGYQEAQEEFLRVYYAARERSAGSLLGRLTLRQRKCLHPLMLAVIKLKNRFDGITVEVLHDRRTVAEGPVIFAVTHVGKSDVEAVSEAIGSHYTLLSGDFERMHGTVNETFLKLNGVIYVCEHDKADRRSAVTRMVDALKQGSNLMYYPEGAWNLSDHLPVLPCYWGIVQVAQAGSATVIPVAAEQYGKHFVVNIGAAMSMAPYGENLSAAICDLRDAMAALKWEIWESQPSECRAALHGNEWKAFTDARLKEWPLTLDSIQEAIFKPKGITNRADAFRHLAVIRPSAASAFLFNKRLRG